MGLDFLSVEFWRSQAYHARCDSCGRVIVPSQRSLPDNTQHSQETDIHTAGGTRTRNPSKRKAADPRLRSCGHWDRHSQFSLARSQNCEKRVLASSCLSVRPHATTRLPLEEFSLSVISGNFSKICWENSSLVKSDKNKVTLHEDQYTFSIISCSDLLRMKNIWDKSSRETRKTHFIFSNLYFLENSAVYEKLRKNIVELGRPQMTIWRMRTACWILKATKTHTGCVMLACALHAGYLRLQKHTQVV